jgi:hypothetical protein
MLENPGSLNVPWAWAQLLAATADQQNAVAGLPTRALEGPYRYNLSWMVSIALQLFQNAIAL